MENDSERDEKHTGASPERPLCVLTVFAESAFRFLFDTGKEVVINNERSDEGGEREIGGALHIDKCECT